MGQTEQHKQFWFENNWK